MAVGVLRHDSLSSVGRKEPRRGRTGAEICPKGKVLVETRREARRRLAREAKAAGDEAGPKPQADPVYPSGRAAVPCDGAEPVSEAVAVMLFEAIAEVAADRELCARDPSRDFTRRRKITAETLISTLVCWGQRTLGNELRDGFGWHGKAPSASAFCQQWGKLSDKAMPAVMRAFLRRFRAVPYLGRYRLLAADGTGIRVNETGRPETRVRSNQGDAHHDELHPTCAYDVLRHTFEDVVFQGSRKSNEPAALCRIVDRLWPGRSPDGSPLRALWVADRNYYTHNVVCHMVEAGAAFILRATDDRAVGFLGYEPTGEFDVEATRFVTRSKSPRGRSRPHDPQLYRLVKGAQPLDALPPGSKGEYPIALRVVRIAIDPGEDGDPNPDGDRWLNLVTNLPADEFPAELLEATYRLRWTEETAYLHLKHVIGARVQHTRDYSRLCQEVLGRLVLFDACSLGTTGVPVPEPGPKHERATDATTAFQAMMALLRGKEEDVDVEAVAARSTHAVEDGRASKRRKRQSRPVCFKYRC